MTDQTITALKAANLPAVAALKPGTPDTALLVSPINKAVSPRGISTRWTRWTIQIEGSARDTRRYSRLTDLADAVEAVVVALPEFVFGTVEVAYAGYGFVLTFDALETSAIED